MRRPKALALSVFFIDMDRVEIAGQAREQHEVGFSDRLGERRGFADLQEGMRSWPRPTGEERRKLFSLAVQHDVSVKGPAAEHARLGDEMALRHWACG